MTADQNQLRLYRVASRIRDEQRALAAGDRSAVDPKWAFIDLVVEYMKDAPVEDVIRLVNAGAIPKEDNLYGSPVTLAAEHDLSHLIKPLAAAGCAINTPGKEGMTALEHAIAKGSEQKDAATLNALLDLGATGSDQGSMLRYAAYCGHPHNVAAMLDRGHDPNTACPESKETPLMSAIWNLDAGPHMARTVMLLLERGADPNLPQTLIRQATHPKREIKDTQLPINALAEVNTDELTDGEVANILDLMIEKGLKIDHDWHKLHHPLTVCLRITNDRVARLLLERGANPLHVNCFYRDGFTQADLDAATEGGTKPLLTKSPFQKFAQTEMPRTVAYLIEHYNEDPEQLLYDETPLIKTVFHDETLRVFRAAITQKHIAAAVDDEGATATPIPRKSRSSFSL